MISDGTLHHPSCPSVLGPKGSTLGASTLPVYHAPPHGPIVLPRGVTNHLAPGQSLGPNGYLQTPDGRARFILQASDGNLVEYYSLGAGNGGTEVAWATNTAGQGAVRATMQTDGNFVLYDRNGHAVWATGTEGNPGASLWLQGDGNIVLLSAAYKVLWTTFSHPSIEGGITVGLNGAPGEIGAAAPDSDQDPTNTGAAAGATEPTGQAAAGTSTSTYVVGGLAAVAVLALGAKLLERRHATR
jgi:hypothetical protein